MFDSSYFFCLFVFACPHTVNLGVTSAWTSGPEQRISKYTTAFLKNGNENGLKAPGAEVQRVVGDLGDFNRSRVFSKRIKSFEYICTKV